MLRWTKQNEKTYTADYRRISLVVFREHLGWKAEGQEGTFPPDVIGQFHRLGQAQAAAERWVKKNYGESQQVSPEFERAVEVEIRRLCEADETQSWRVVVQAPGHKNKIEKIKVTLDTEYPEDFEYEAELRSRLKVAKETNTIIHAVKALSSRRLR